MVTALWGNRRTIWDNKTNGLHVDIFIDKLEMNHDILFQDRLEIDPLTISLADMLLEKMQIVHLEEKDMVDTTMLLRKHDIGKAGPETIRRGLHSEVAIERLGLLLHLYNQPEEPRLKLATYQELTQEDRNDVGAKIEKLLRIIEDEPKTMRWKIRAKVGTSKKWYRDVEEVRR